MDCNHIDDLLMDYLYQELDTAQMERVEAHLQGCDRCSDELTAFDDTRGLLSDGFVDEDPPPQISAAILQEAARAVEQTPQGTFWQRLHAGLRAMVMHPGMTGAVTLVLVLGVSFYAYQNNPKSADGPHGDLPLIKAGEGSADRTATISVPQGEAQAPQLAGLTDKTQARERLKEANEKEGTRPTAATGQGFEQPGRRASNRGKGGAVVPIPEPRQLQQAMQQPAAQKGGARNQRLGNTVSTGNEFKNNLNTMDDFDSLANKDEAKPAQGGRGRAVATASEPAADKPSPRPYQVVKRTGKAGWADKGDYAPKRKQARRKPSAKPASSLDALEDDVLVQQAKPAPTKKPAPASPPTSGPYKSQGSLNSLTGSVANAPAKPVSSKSRAKAEDPKAADAKQAKAKIAADIYLREAENAAAKKDCMTAFYYYDRALQYRPELISRMSSRVRSCAAIVAQGDERPLIKAQKKFPRLAGLLQPEVTRYRKARTAKRARARKAPAKAKKKIRVDTVEQKATTKSAY